MRRDLVWIHHSIYFLLWNYYAIVNMQKYKNTKQQIKQFKIKLPSLK